jgi:hypothetical protein
MPDDTTTASGMPDLGDADALMSRLAVIEDQALEERAAAFVQLHDELRRVLEGPDASA